MDIKTLELQLDDKIGDYIFDGELEQELVVCEEYLKKYFPHAGDTILVSYSNQEFPDAIKIKFMSVSSAGTVYKVDYGDSQFVYYALRVLLKTLKSEDVWVRVDNI